MNKNLGINFITDKKIALRLARNAIQLSKLHARPSFKLQLGKILRKKIVDWKSLNVFQYVKKQLSILIKTEYNKKRLRSIEVDSKDSVSTFYLYLNILVNYM